MASKLLEPEKQEWIESHLAKWGAWVFSGLDFDKRMNMIARLMLSADPNRITVPVREMCNDELGLVMSAVVGYYVKNPSPNDFKYLEAKYVYGLSVYAIAKYMRSKDSSIGLRAWQKRVAESIRASEWIVAKFLDLALKNHKNAGKLKNFAFGL